MMLLSADWVLPVSDPPVAQGAVLVSAGAIAAIGAAAELKARYGEEELLEFPGCAILPGFVNAHSHLEYSAFRGFASPSGFSRWIFQLLRARRKVADADWAAAALWGAHESLRNGITSIADTSYDGVAVAQAAQAVGLRARVYLELFGLDDTRLSASIERLEASLDHARRMVGAAEGAVDTIEMPVEWGISPHAPYTVSQRLYEEAARFGRDAGLPLATHVAESRSEVRLLSGSLSALALAYKATRLWTGRRWEPPRTTPVQYVAGTGALGPDTLVVHAVQVNSDDIAILADSGSAVAHCPRSNLRLRCGRAPVAEMKAAGISVGLGTDSLASNDSLDMVAEMRAAMEISQARGARETSLRPGTILRMATLEGAQALGWGHLVGSLEAGKRADMVVVRLRAEDLLDGCRRTEEVGPGLPGPDRAEQMDIFAQAVMRAEVQMTMVDGKIVYGGEEIPADVAQGFRMARTRLGLRTCGSPGRRVVRRHEGR
jgi:5-methylthioadenosine/S-adenosylhomocysteine deaminase